MFRITRVSNSFFRRFSTITPVVAEPKSWIQHGTTFVGRSIYMDMQATTPVDPRVFTKMMPFWLEQFGNAHSRTHMYGWEAEDAVEEARAHVARLIGADEREVIFTSGATESNNIAIKGVANFVIANTNTSSNKIVKNHIITTQTEHKCVLDSCRYLQQHHKMEITYLPVQKDGLINLQQLREEIRPSTCLVSVMAVNNEIGVIQPLKDIGQVCKDHNVLFHTDAAQALGKIHLDVEKQKIDLLSMSSHKIYGPKGIGALYLRRKPRIRLQSIISGGGQERGIRSGTLATPLIVGFGEACRVAKEEMNYDHQHISNLYQRLYHRITSSLTHVHLNGSTTHRYPGNLNLSFAGVEGEALMMAIKNVSVSSGSACTSSSLEPSYVLRAIGIKDDLAHTSIRFGIGRFTTQEEVDYVSDLVIDKVTALREMSPVWDMIQEGIDPNEATQWVHK